MDYETAIASLTRWAQAADSVRGLVLTGSAAVGADHPLSDRDIEVFTTDVKALLDDESWWADLGEVIAVERLEDDEGTPTRLVYFAGGKFDFTLLPAEALRDRVYSRPFRALLDKDRRAATAVLRPEQSQPPSEAEFDEVVNWAWAAALMAAKAIVRDEPWSAKLRDQDLKEQLLCVIEWDHRLRHGTRLDTRYLGTRMRQWMDPDVQESLEHCWSTMEAAASATALRASVDLFARLATRIADQLSYRSVDHDRARAELEAILRTGGR